MTWWRARLPVPAYTAGRNPDARAVGPASTRAIRSPSSAVTAAGGTRQRRGAAPGGDFERREFGQAGLTQYRSRGRTGRTGSADERGVERGGDVEPAVLDADESDVPAAADGHVNRAGAVEAGCV